MIRILHADDHPLILKGVRELLEGRHDMTVVGQETDSDCVVKAVARLRPDVLIQDLEMGGQLSGIEVIHHVRQKFPSTSVVVLSMHSSAASAWEAMQQGAMGYVTKLGDFNDLIRAVRTVAAGDHFIGAPLSEAELEIFTEQLAERGVRSLSILTRREMEVLRMVARGHTSSEIAQILHLSRRTVETHRQRMASKLGLRNQAEITRYAMERGLVADA